MKKVRNFIMCFCLSLCCLNVQPVKAESEKYDTPILRVPAKTEKDQTFDYGTFGKFKITLVLSWNPGTNSYVYSSYRVEHSGGRNAGYQSISIDGRSDSYVRFKLYAYSDYGANKAYFYPTVNF